MKARYPSMKKRLIATENKTVWEIYELDMWGNEEDGWDCNQEFPTGRFIEDMPEDNEKLIEKVKEWYTFKCNVEVEDWANGTIEIKNAETGEPLLRIVEHEA